MMGYRAVNLDADHHVRGLNYGIGLLALFQLQLGDGFVGDRGGDGGAAAAFEATCAVVAPFLTLDGVPLMRLRALSFMAASLLSVGATAALDSCPNI